MDLNRIIRTSLFQARSAQWAQSLVDGCVAKASSADRVEGEGSFCGVSKKLGVTLHPLVLQIGKILSRSDLRDDRCLSWVIGVRRTAHLTEKARLGCVGWETALASVAIIIKPNVLCCASQKPLALIAGSKDVYKSSLRCATCTTVTARLLWRSLVRRPCRLQHMSICQSRMSRLSFDIIPLFPIPLKCQTTVLDLSCSWSGRALVACQSAAQDLTAAPGDIGVG
ncbi:hypothetical protein C7974DRAFT_402773 [Boeremia exigua]|uniref:uncharacterized protein n=1 Tax=Boeremia exigua TaxID=749465 RepID=UPI001E8ED2B3|nr:uncharacterized protein C7974DRAFT_402773 [Boeremia exigua]KAH6614852.1 hypothetical protein C7974DRAFT_402773 [Boeremia exigua]